ncbi:hypothetical protein EDB80DRAFT_837644 [Ilyonectria destructans]|nr:hypothetical protein EDB80DRAFT_837644 [Ilyonectria destructans]
MQTQPQPQEADARLGERRWQRAEEAGRKQGEGLRSPANTGQQQLAAANNSRMNRDLPTHLGSSDHTTFDPHANAVPGKGDGTGRVFLIHSPADAQQRLGSMGHAARALGDRHGRMHTVLLARGACLSWPIGLPSAAPFEPLAGSGDATSAFTVRMENYTASTYPDAKLGGYLAARYLAARYLLSRAEDGVASRAHGQVDLLMMEPRTTREEPMVLLDLGGSDTCFTLRQKQSMHRSVCLSPRSISVCPPLNQYTQPVSRISGSAEKFAWMGNPSRDAPLVTDHPGSTGHRALSWMERG